jgi:hypothetical protein
LIKAIFTVHQIDRISVALKYGSRRGRTIDPAFRARTEPKAATQGEASDELFDTTA